MRVSVVVTAIAAAGLMVIAGQMVSGQSAAAGSARGVDVRGGEAISAGTIGPDVALCHIAGFSNYGTSNGIAAFAIGTDSWNIGDETLLWEANNSNHPVIAQNMYRYADGRLEMIGISWLKHGFCALQLSGCSSCPGGGGCPQYLLPGCRDPYDSSLNGSQFYLGPRSDVNASTGEFPYPYTIGFQQTGGTTYKRLQVAVDDIDPDLNQGASYFVEGHYIHPQEGMSDRRHNNASYRPVQVGTGFGGAYTLLSNQPSVQLLPAIYAWQDIDAQVVIEAIDVPDDGRFHVGYRVFDQRNGTWRYEYAVHNFNSHRSAQGFTVPLQPGATIHGTFHSDIKYHSGEIYTNEDWATTITSDQVTWSGQTHAESPNANALRWSTLFNFSVVTNTPPVMDEVTIHLFRPGTPDAVNVSALVPGEVEPAPCPADLTGDQAVGLADLLELINNWGACPNPNDCPADLTGNGSVGLADLLELINQWGPC